MNKSEPSPIDIDKMEPATVTETTPSAEAASAPKPLGSTSTIRTAIVTQTDNADVVAQKLPPLVVVIDEDAAFTDAALQFFGSKAEVTVLKSSEEVLNYAPARAPAMIVANANLGGVDIRTDVMALRTRFPYERMSLIALSDAFDSDLTRFNRSLGFDNTFAKPVEFSVLDMYWARATATRPPTRIVPKLVTAENFEERKTQILKKSGLAQDGSDLELPESTTETTPSKTPSGVVNAIGGGITRSRIAAVKASPLAGSKAKENGKTTDAPSLSVKKIILGFLLGLGAGVLLALPPWGYNYPLAVLEGPLLGLLVGLGLSCGHNALQVKQFKTLLILACVAAFVSTGVVFATRTALERPFKEQREVKVRTLFPGEQMGEKLGNRVDPIPPEQFVPGIDINTIQSMLKLIAGFLVAPMIAAVVVFRRAKGV